MTKINSTVIIMALALFAFVQGAWAGDAIWILDEAGLLQAVSASSSETPPDGYSLSNDITLTQCIVIENGHSLHLDLMGKSLKRGLGSASSGSDDGCVFHVKHEGSLRISDASGNNSGAITGGYSSKGGGIWNEGVVLIEGGRIKNNKGTDGGGIYNAENATLLMSGGVISSNWSYAGGGGVVNYGTAAFDNVTIENNVATTRGGGIWNNGMATLSNSDVHGNSADINGGGIYNKNELNMFYVMKVKDNLRGSVADNVFLVDGTVITLKGNLQEGSQIGVSTEKSSATVTSGRVTYPFDLSSNYIVADANRELVIENDEVASYAYYYIERTTSGSEIKRYLKSGEYQMLSTWLKTNTSVSLPSGIYVADTLCLVSCSKSFGAVNRLVVPTGNTVRLVLVDGVQLTMNKGINVAPSTESTSNAGRLYIYGQKNGTGKLIANGESKQAGIGGNDGKGNGLIEIHGGYVQSTGGDYGAGIGTGNKPVSWRSAIYIYGGTVVTQGGTDAAGIGGGNEGKSPKVFIYGGTVNATGGEHGSGIGGGDDSGIYGVSIYGGTVTAQGGDYGAGIGTGDEAGANTSDPILIKGGTVTATGGTKGAGIGGGNESESPAVTIDGGVVTANGTGTQYAGGAGIGGGDEYPQGGKITINGGTVTAKGGGIAAAGIGGGGAGTASGDGLCGNTNKGGEVQITGGNVTVIANHSGAGIGGGSKAVRGAVTITGGNHYIEGLMGSAIGGGYGFTYHFSDCEPDIVFGPKIIVSSAKYNGESQQFENSYTNATSSDRNDTCHANKRRVWIRSCDHQDGIYYTLPLASREKEHAVICKWCGYRHTEDHLQTSDGTCDICGYKFDLGWWTITLNEASVSYSETDVFVTRGAKYVLPEPSSTPVGYAFVGWYLGPMSHLVAGGYMVDPPEGVDAYLWQSGEEIEVTGDINLVACYAQTDFGAVYIDPYRMSAIINGNYKGTGVVDIQEEYVVDEVYFNREFVKDVPSTITLPFETTIGQVEGANFYDITNLVIEDGVWHVKTHRLGKNGENNNTIVANKPYLLKPTANGQIIFHPGEDGFTLNTTEKRSYTVDGDPSISGDKWSFRGAYNYIVLGDSTGILGRAYGFSAETDGDIPVGMFVRGGADADIPALRAYLVHEKAPSPIKASFLNNTQLTSASKVNYSLEMPSETVVIDFDDEERTTVIGTLNPVTGQIRINSAERWFDVQGRLLKGKPTAKGRYFHNGRVEIIK